MRNQAISRTTRPSGHLSMVKTDGRDLKPQHGCKKAPAWQPLPDNLPWKAWFKSIAKELTLRVRMAVNGAYRGVVYGTGVFGASRLYAEVHRGNGTIERLGLISTKVITDAGVTFMRDDFNNNAEDITTFNYHGCGTGTNAEAAGDTALQTESTTALNPDSTRATGTRSTPASNQFRTVGTLTFDADTAVTEHGILSQSATGGGTLWDRSKFTAINVVGANGDSIQFTYTLTLSSGG